MLHADMKTKGIPIAVIIARFIFQHTHISVFVLPVQKHNIAWAHMQQRMTTSVPVEHLGHLHTLPHLMSSMTLQYVQLRGRLKGSAHSLQWR